MSKSTPTQDTPSPPSPTSKEVGYCKPPKKSQWKKGQSGNPSGKKKGTKSFKKMFLAVAGKTVTVVNANGVKKKQTLAETLVNKVFENGLTGNTQMTTQAAALLHKFSPPDSDYEPPKHGQVLKQGGKVYLSIWISQETSDEIKRLKRVMPELLSEHSHLQSEPT